MEQKKDRALFIMKCLLCAYVVTGVLLLILALLLYRFQLSENVVDIGIIVIYVLSSFLAGWICGKKAKTRRFLWGLAMGCIYFFVLILISLAVNHTMKDVAMHFWTTLLVCAGSGMLGGMIS
ncbi:MAG: TIGR04086 family membrane protein [Lachnospiraceae bacterium]|nr:TIGR04086 family membrane protein [Lachnospiraceae bacterium]